jgi:hypothetical protein
MELLPGDLVLATSIPSVPRKVRRLDCSPYKIIQNVIRMDSTNVRFFPV